MTAWSQAAAGAALVFFACGLFVPSWLAHRRRFARQLRAELVVAWEVARKYAADADRYEAAYHLKVREQAVLLRRFGGDNPLAVGAEAAVEALTEDERAWEGELKT